MRIVIELDERPAELRLETASAAAGSQATVGFSPDKANVAYASGGIDGGPAPTTLPMGSGAVPSEASAVLPVSPPPAADLSPPAGLPERDGSSVPADENAGPAPGTQLEGPVVELEEEEG